MIKILKSREEGITVEEWDNLDQQCLDELVDSMPRRIQACINARGRATWY